jgi:hypothetical protein
MVLMGRHCGGPGNPAAAGQGPSPGSSAVSLADPAACTSRKGRETAQLAVTVTWLRPCLNILQGFNKAQYMQEMCAVVCSRTRSLTWWFVEGCVMACDTSHDMNPTRQYTAITQQQDTSHLHSPQGGIPADQALCFLEELRFGVPAVPGSCTTAC